MLNETALLVVKGLDEQLGLTDGMNGLLSKERNREICQVAEETFAKHCKKYTYLQLLADEENTIEEIWKAYNEVLLKLENVVRRGAKVNHPFIVDMRKRFTDKELVLFLD